MVDYTIRPEDNKEKLDFSAPDEEIVVTVPVETVNVVFPEEFRVMVALDQAIKLKLFGQPGVTVFGNPTINIEDPWGNVTQETNNG